MAPFFFWMIGMRELVKCQATFAASITSMKTSITLSHALFFERKLGLQTRLSDGLLGLAKAKTQARLSFPLLKWCTSSYIPILMNESRRWTCEGKGKDKKMKEVIKRGNIKQNPSILLHSFKTFTHLKEISPWLLGQESIFGRCHAYGHLCVDSEWHGRRENPNAKVDCDKVGIFF